MGEDEDWDADSPQKETNTKLQNVNANRVGLNEYGSSANAFNRPTTAAVGGRAVPQQRKPKQNLDNELDDLEDWDKSRPTTSGGIGLGGGLGSRQK